MDVYQQSLQESMSEALSDEVPLARSMPSPSAPIHAIEPDSVERPQTPKAPSIHLDSQPDPVAAVAEGNPESSQPLPMVPSDRPNNALGDWMGTWWSKGRSRQRQDDVGTGTSAERRPTGKQRRRNARSVFGTLGISVLNPGSPSSLPKAANEVDPETPAGVVSTKSVTVDTPSDKDTFSVTSPSAYVEPSHASAMEDIQALPAQGSSLRAIANATRVMTRDPASILVDAGHDIGPLIASLALRLISNARDDGIQFHERKGRKPTISLPLVRLPETPSTSAQDKLDASSVVTRVGSSGYKVTTASLAPAFAIASPLFASFKTPPLPPRPFASSSSAAAQSTDNASNVTPPALTRKTASVPLDSIVPATSKPPTQYLSRTYTPLTAKDFRISIPQSRSRIRFDLNHQPLADRYGFVYDIAQYDVLLLSRAKECGNTAPACLTGVKIADRREDNSWPGEEDDEYEDASGNTNKPFLEVFQDNSCDCHVDTDIASVKSRDSASASPYADSIFTSRSSSKSRKRSSMVSSNLGGASTMTSMTSVLSVSADGPKHACPTIVRDLLDALTDIHDQRQTMSLKDWDVFVSQRRKASKTSKSSQHIQSSTIGGAAHMLGLGTADEEEELEHSEGLIWFAQMSGKDERRELSRLLRRGIPLVYRAKVWYECSGGLEMQEPGLFQDLLNAPADTDGVLEEIEKDVGRTMPLNLFFGGDGPGVDKLRKVLIAYSR